MTWMLDTNACIRYLNGRAPNLRARIDLIDPRDLKVCSVVKAELYYGAARSANPVRSLERQKFFLSKFQSLVFDDIAADAYGVIRADLEQRGKPIGPNDLMIAAIAMANGVTLVTHNVSEFGRVNGLAVEDWEG